MSILDFNGDGKQDIAYANNNIVGNVVIRLGNDGYLFDFPIKGETITTTEDGTGKLCLQKPQILLTQSVFINKSSKQLLLEFRRDRNLLQGIYPTDITKADVNNDGIQDLIIANGGIPQKDFGVKILNTYYSDIIHGGNSSISVALGNGLGYDFDLKRYQISEVFFDQVENEGTTSVKIAVGDINNDGHLDIVSASKDEDRIVILTGDGDGDFNDGVKLYGVKNPTDIVVTDYNNDGKQDIIVTNGAENKVTIFYNGLFNVPVSIPVGKNPSSIDIADLNADGKNDIIVTNSSDDTISIIINGTNEIITYKVGKNPIAIKVGKFNNDSLLDLAVLNQGDNTITILKGVFPKQEITVSGNNETVIETELASINNFTDFGIMNAPYSKERVFKIKNTGSGKILSGTISITGNNSQKFQIVKQPTFPLETDSDSELIIKYTPNTQLSVDNASVSLTLKTCNGLFNFNFKIKGESVLGPNFDANNYLDKTVNIGSNKILEATNKSLFSTIIKANVLPESNFEGIISLDPKTGNFQVTNPRKAGEFDFEVKITDDRNLFTINNIKLIFENKNQCVLENSSIEKQSFPITYLDSGNSYKNIIIGDFNNDLIQDFANVIEKKSYTGSFLVEYFLEVFLGDENGLFNEFDTTLLVDVAGSIFYFSDSKPTVDIQIQDLNGDGNQDLVCKANNKTIYLVGDGKGHFVKTSDTYEDLVLNFQERFNGDFNRDAIPDYIEMTADHIKIFQRQSSFEVFNIYEKFINQRSIYTIENSCINKEITESFWIKNKSTTQDLIILENSIFFSGEDKALFSINNLNFPLTIAPGDSKKIDVAYKPLSAGVNETILEIRGECSNDSFKLKINGNAIDAPIPTGGNYSNTTIIAGSNTTLSFNFTTTQSKEIANSAIAFSTSNFDGKLAINPVTGDLQVTNPTVPGIYKIIAIFNNFCANFKTDFQLTVTDPNCSDAYFNPKTTENVSQVLSVATNYIFFTTFSNVSGNPDFIEIGDFNNDGNQDFITANSAINTISIRFGDGNGGVSASKEIRVGNYPKSLAIGDLNGDGLQDIVVNYNSGSFNSLGKNPNYLTILVGNDTNDFEVRNVLLPESNVNNASGIIKLKDINNDGNLDIIESYGDTNNLKNIRVFLSRNSMLENFQIINSLELNNFSSFDIGDFNGDEIYDIVVSELDDQKISLFTGDGKGNFTKASSIANTSTNLVKISDFNRDNKLDLAIIYNNSSKLGVSLGDGNGGISALTEINLKTNDAIYSSINFADFNGNGDTDIALLDSKNDVINILRGDGLGGFNLPIAIPIENPETYNIKLDESHFFKVADLNNDGYQDLIVTNPKSLKVSILTGKPTVNGLIELLASNGKTLINGSTIPTIENNTDFGNIGTYTNKKRIFTIVNKGDEDLILEDNAITITGQNASLFHLEDISFPLKIDKNSSKYFSINLVATGVIGEKKATVNISKGGCNTAFNLFSFDVKAKVTDKPEIPTYSDATINIGGNSKIYPNGVNLGDVISMTANSSPNFNGIFNVDPLSGIVSVTNATTSGDFLITVKSFNTNNVSNSTTFNLKVNKADCSELNFETKYWSDLKFQNYGTDPNKGLAIGDFNNDGIQDIISLESRSIAPPDIIIYLGTSTGNFTKNATIKLDNEIYISGVFSIKIADFNGDGFQDISFSSSEKIIIFLGVGDGSFIKKNEIIKKNKIGVFDIGDFNNDGITDLIILENEFMKIWIGDGKGNFFDTDNFKINYGISDNSSSIITINDFNNDGNEDVFSSNSTYEYLYLGDGNGNFNMAFSRYKDYSFIYGKNKKMSSGDFNADGNQDVAIIEESGKISISNGNGMGKFEDKISVTIGDEPQKLDIGDINGDGIQDIIIADSDISIIYGSLTNQFKTTKIQPQINQNSKPNSIAVGNFNSDNKLDIVSLITSSDAISSNYFFTFSKSKINIKGKKDNLEVLIEVADDNPTELKQTDFGQYVCINSTKTNTFKIENTSNDQLIINQNDFNISGIDASMFAISGVNFPYALSAGTETIFNITFSPTSEGTKTAKVNLNIDDCGFPNYSFDVKGTSIQNGNTLGNTYSDTTVLAGNNIKITPNESVFEIKEAIVYASDSNFSAIITINPITGVIAVTNPIIAGEYVINIAGASCSNVSTTSFVLTVKKPAESSAEFTEKSILNTDITIDNNFKLADFNNDGINDFITESEGTITNINDNYTIYLGNDTGSFTKGEQISIFESGKYFRIQGSFNIGDFNNDGNQDFAVGIAELNSNEYFIYIYSGNGEGKFSKTIVLKSNKNTFSSSLRIKTADINRDGLNDLVSYYDQTVSVYLANKFGTFSQLADINLSYRVGNIFIGDWNNDLKEDVIIFETYFTNPSIHILFGDGNGGFYEDSVINGLDNIYSPLIGDYNNDKIEDIFITEIVSGKAKSKVYLGTSSGKFAFISQNDYDTNLFGMESADYNGDGKLDVFSLRSYTATSGIIEYEYQVLQGNGDGSFIEKTRNKLDTNTSGIKTVDFNKDGKLDIIKFFQKSISVLLNEGPEIEIKGNNIIVLDNSTVTSKENNTDFGTETNSTKEFEIHNIGTKDLILNNGAITITGNDAVLFSLPANITYPTVIAANSKYILPITYLVNSSIPLGVKNATVNIISNDSDEQNYNFAIKAEHKDNPPIIVCPTINSSYITDVGKNYATINLIVNVTDDFTSSPIITDNRLQNNQYPIGTTIVTFTAKDTSGNESSCSITIIVEDKELPSLSCINDISIKDSDSKDPLNTGIPNSTDNSSSINLTYIDVINSPITGCSKSVITRKWRATDASGNFSECIQTIAVSDTEKPTLIVKDITVQLGIDGTASINYADIDNGSSDNCGIANYTIDKNKFTCSDINDNPNKVTLTVTDNNGNIESAIANVIVEDNIAPIVVIKDIRVNLDTNGLVIISPEDIDDGTYDNCKINSLILSKTNFSCTDLGSNIVTFTAVDESGNFTSKNAKITIEDKEPPIIVGKDITIVLNTAGNANITATDLIESFIDNCNNGLTFSVDKNSFTIQDAINSPISVELMATDGSGNSSTDIVLVSVLDPTIIVNTHPITVNLDANGSVTITPNQLDNGSNSGVGIASLKLDKETFTCSDIGNQIVNFTVENNNGDKVTKQEIVTIQDTSLPITKIKNIIVRLNSNGIVSITPFNVNNGSSDNCSISTYSLDKTTFTCADLGANTITFTVTDTNGNTSSQTATVIVEDKFVPTVITKNITVELDTNGTASITANDIDNGSSDNCSIATYSLDKTTFTCADLGANTITLIVTDTNGNTSSQTATVIVEDKFVPTVITKNITVELDANGTASITANDIDNGSSDNCSIATYSLDISTFTCADLGANTITLIVTDTNGNTSLQTATVLVEDKIKPIVIGKNIIIDLNKNPSVNISAADLDNGSTDNCSFTLTVDKDTFSEIGDYNVILTATDTFNNKSVISVIVTITNTTLSLVEIKENDFNLELFPIPIKDFVIISTELDIDRLEIFDITGRSIRKIDRPTKKINMTRFKTGFYLIIFNYRGKNIIKKVFKE